MRSCQACPEGNTTESLTPGPAPHRHHIPRPALWLWPFRSGGQNQSRNLMQFVIKPTNGQTVFAFKFWFSNHRYFSRTTFEQEIIAFSEMGYKIQHNLFWFVNLAKVTNYPVSPGMRDYQACGTVRAKAGRVWGRPVTDAVRIAKIESELTVKFTPISGWKMLVTQLCLTLCNSKDCSPPGSSVHGIFEKILEYKNTGVGSHSFLQEIFLTQGLNLGLLYCRHILYLWS